ncbi:oligosaccharide flippase family protein [Flavobacterium sp. LB3P45]|uniref:Oligosaccharide flippase family protein n=1 Tax=Flavobacterium fructosi TaxID=3230416 RepID=A0ABW6HJM2_9FLAO
MNFPSIPKKLSSDHVFMLTMLVVNAGNYIYNLLVGRILGPSEFSDAAILITFLLILSFLGMTFQIVVAKYAVLYENQKLQLFVVTVTKFAVFFGVIFGAIILFFNEELQILFHTKTAAMFILFAMGIPLYFLMSVNRGLYQGGNDLNRMSITYITEMVSRLFLTVALVLLVPTLPTSVAVAAGISMSLVFGLFPFQKSIGIRTNISKTNEILDTKSIVTFFALTAFYELTQIIINNSDIILVKHYFNSKEAGLYASLALIGRVVYFVAWMFVMLLLPKVILLKKEGKDTLPILMKYVGYIAVLSVGIILFTFLFPAFVVKVMFGEKYISIAFLLWKYALATSVFAIANIFAYYFLSMNKYIPVIISAVLGLAQIGLIVLFHNSLQQVVEMQIIAMLILLFFQLCFFFNHNKKNARLYK